jgi:hypothetical protein
MSLCNIFLFAYLHLFLIVLSVFIIILFNFELKPYVIIWGYLEWFTPSCFRRVCIATINVI